MFLAILIFDPNWPICKGYSLCKMADFQNRLISRIFGFCFQRFFAQNNSSLLVQPFCACFLAILIFDPNWPICKGYSLCKMADFQNRVICRTFGVCFHFFFAQKKCSVLVQPCCPCFLAMLIFYPNWAFCKGYTLCQIADFQNRLISRIFGVFSNGILHRTTLVF